MKFALVTREPSDHIPSKKFIHHYLHCVKISVRSDLKWRKSY